MSRFAAIDLTGQRFGELIVERRAPTPKHDGGPWWACRCDCGAPCSRPARLLLARRIGRGEACDICAAELVNGRREARRQARIDRYRERAEDGDSLWTMAELELIEADIRAAVARDMGWPEDDALPCPLFTEGLPSGASLKRPNRDPDAPEHAVSKARRDAYRSKARRELGLDREKLAIELATKRARAEAWAHANERARSIAIPRLQDMRRDKGVNR